MYIFTQTYIYLHACIILNGAYVELTKVNYSKRQKPRHRLEQPEAQSGLTCFLPWFPDGERETARARGSERKRERDKLINARTPTTTHIPPAPPHTHQGIMDEFMVCIHI